jgi:AcrR family transcriptional regulator
MPTSTRGLSGRKAEAARNDRTILDAARMVFLRDPSAPMSAVAEAAGVGVGALYRRYAGKEALLQTLCGDGLHRFIAIAQTALADDTDAWRAFAGFLRGIIDSDVHSLTVHLAGTFTPTDELHTLAERATALANRVFRRARASGALRADLQANDLAMLFEQIAAIHLGTGERTTVLRRRYLALLLDGLRADAATTRLPGLPPTGAELAARWRPSNATPRGRRA